MKNAKKMIEIMDQNEGDIYLFPAYCLTGSSAGELYDFPEFKQQTEDALDKLCEYKGDYIGMREARKHAAWYIRDIRGAAKYRNEIGTLTSMDELKILAEKVIEANK